MGLVLSHEPLTPPQPDTAMNDSEIIAQIEKLQAIQKTHHHKAPAWQQASEMLAPLFKEMARRTAH